MNKHIQLLGVLFIVLSILGLIVAAITLLAFAGMGVASGGGDEFVALSGFGLVIAIFIGALSLPGLIGGYGLIRRYSWSRMLGIIISVLHLFSFPLGTALGIYGLWVLFQPEAVAILASSNRAPNSSPHHQV